MYLKNVKNIFTYGALEYNVTCTCEMCTVIVYSIVHSSICYKLSGIHLFGVGGFEASEVFVVKTKFYESKIIFIY